LRLRFHGHEERFRPLREDRMQRMFQADKVRFRRPAAAAEQWFNLLLIHQNRDQRTLRTKAARLLLAARQPVIWAGQGVQLARPGAAGDIAHAMWSDAQNLSSTIS
jgi:hypothetical protein